MSWNLPPVLFFCVSWWCPMWSCPALSWMGHLSQCHPAGLRPQPMVFSCFSSLCLHLSCQLKGKLPALQTAPPHALLAQGALPPSLRLLRWHWNLTVFSFFPAWAMEMLSCCLGGAGLFSGCLWSCWLVSARFDGERTVSASWHHVSGRDPASAVAAGVLGACCHGQRFLQGATRPHRRRNAVIAPAARKASRKVCSCCC